MERAPGHPLLQACEDGLAEDLTAAGIPHVMEHGQAVPTITPSPPRLAQEAEVFRHRSEDEGLAVDVPSRPEVGLGRAIPFHRFRQLAAYHVNEPLHPSNAAQDVNIS